MSASSDIGSPTVQTTTWVLMNRRADCDEDGSRIGPWGVWVRVSDPIHPRGMAIRHMRRFGDLVYYAVVRRTDASRLVPRAWCQWKLTRL